MSAVRLGSYACAAAGEQLGRYAELGQFFVHRGEVRQRLLSPGDMQRARPFIADGDTTVGFDAVDECVEQRQAASAEREEGTAFGGLRIGGEHAARRLGGTCAWRPAIQDGDRGAAPGQFCCDCAADNAGPDDNDVAGHA